MIAHVSCQIVPCVVVYTTYLTIFLQFTFLCSYLLHCLLLVASSLITADLAMILRIMSGMCEYYPDPCKSLVHPTQPDYTQLLCSCYMHRRHAVSGLLGAS